MSSLVFPDSSSHGQSHVSSLPNDHNDFADTLLESGSLRQNTAQLVMDSTAENDLEAKRPPYWHVSEL